jgi:hypothetical protein
LHHSISVNTLLGQEFVDAMHAKRSITITSTAALSTRTTRANRVSAQNAGDQRAEMARLIFISEKNRIAISAPVHRIVTFCDCSTTPLL